MVRSSFRFLSLIILSAFLWACTQGGGGRRPGGAMDGVGDGLGGNQAAPSLGDMGADTNEGTTDSCQCGNYPEGGCRPCLDETLGIPEEPNPPPPPGPQSLKFMADPGDQPGWDVEEDIGDDDDVDEDDYEDTLNLNSF
ncbi:MAG: hypothetical protein R3257_04370 [bacterium]|nr:hypothetical protein [bacterium]